MGYADALAVTMKPEILSGCGVVLSGIITSERTAKYGEFPKGPSRQLTVTHWLTPFSGDSI